MKRIIAILISLVIFTINISATGDPNIDGGGGGMGTGNNDNGWAIKYSDGSFGFDLEGLRVYVVDKDTGVHITAFNTIDITNTSLPSENISHFGYKTKLEYRNDQSLNLQTSSYVTKKPQGLNIPKIISFDGTGNEQIYSHKTLDFKL